MKVANQDLETVSTVALFMNETLCITAEQVPSNTCHVCMY